ncbi:hypothetical protein AX16_000244 [Volvariella volvacea WC 439]|nr:hypothetical protein AX16_000244 [Volvariella volvacea WC 439]
MVKPDDLLMAPQANKKQVDPPLPVDVVQKPLQLQRRRVWRACESCRRKKIKCDGCEPTCSQCTMSGSQCTWLQTKDRAALSRHYVQELEARLLHMESLFAQIAPVLEQIGPGATGGPINLPPASTAAAGAASARPPSEGTLPRPSNSSTPASIPEDKVLEPPSPSVKTEDDVSESFGQLALDEYGHMRWIGGSSTMSLIQSFRALTSSPLHRTSPMEEDPQAPGPSVNKLYFPASVFFGKVHALPGPEEVEYPDRDLADKLIDAYFARLHFLMPIIDKPSFLRQYKYVMDNRHDQTLSRRETPFLSLIFAIFACAVPLVQDPRLSTSDRTDDGGMGMVYYERALILQYISHANIQIAHVQCSILMSSFLCSVNCLPQAWILIGQAVRTGQDLGLHRSPRRLQISAIEKETRRKIWWGVYVLDRMLALALGRPLGINDADCDVELPADVDDEYLPQYFSGAPPAQKPRSLMCGNIALIQLYKIGGQVLRQVYALENCRDNLELERKQELQKLVESLDNELTKWCEELPPIFKAQSETDEQVSLGAVLCSHYYSILTTLHRNLIPVKRDSPVTARSTAKAVSSARGCIRLAPSMKNVVPPSHHLAFFIQHLFSSAVILLLYAMHAPDPRAASAAMDEAKSSLSALESWEGQWPGARKCKELLVELTETANEAIKSHSTPNQVASSSAAARAERRRSVTIASTPTSSAPSGRLPKSRTRRNQSRDPSVSSSSRRLAAVSPYRVDSAQRARSSSRRRPLDENETASNDRSSGPLAPYYQSFPSPPSNQGTNSPHSSPAASDNLPSPAMPNLDASQETSPQLATSPVYSSYASPISPVQQSSSRFDFDYTMHNNSLSQTASQVWNGTNNGTLNGGAPNSVDRRGMDVYPTGNDLALYGASFGGFPALDPVFAGFDTNGGLAGMSTTPPGSSFAATGLPFHGLEYIRNYAPGVYVGEQESLWQSYDPGAFGLDPDLPFAFGDQHLPTDGPDNLH